MTSAISVQSLSLSQSVRATVASMADQFRPILGSEPIVEINQHVQNGYVFTIATYGAGVYKQVAQFSMRQLSGCCGVLVFFHASVANTFRNKGLGTLLLKVRENAAIQAGYTVAQATILETNEAEIRILERANWKTHFQFTNARTGNNVVVMMKTLNRS